MTKYYDVATTSTARRTLVAPRAASPVDWPLLPWARGPLSATVLAALQRTPGTLGSTPPFAQLDPLTDNDFALALYLCYEVHFRSLVDPEWEWDLDLLRFRAGLERHFEERLRDEVGSVAPLLPFDVPTILDDLVREFPGRSLATYLAQEGTLDQFREFCVHRSAHQLRRSDPTDFANSDFLREDTPNTLEGSLTDDSAWGPFPMRSTLFAGTMVALGLDPSLGSYVEILPGVTLATVNFTSMLTLHRRWRAARAGNLVFGGPDSEESFAQLSDALALLGVGPQGRRYFDARLDGNARHGTQRREQWVVRLVRDEPRLARDVLFGVRATMLLEDRLSHHLLKAWARGTTSLVPWMNTGAEPNDDEGFRDSQGWSTRRSTE